jgi:pyruvate/oxaloacetate carboxyltransferase
MNETIRNIVAYIPNEKIRFFKHKITGDLQLELTDKKAIMTILKETSWTEIKRHIDVKMNPKYGECPICFTKDIKRRVTCSKCIAAHCIDCYIEMFVKNHGKSICPFCRFTIGTTNLF